MSNKPVSLNELDALKQLHIIRSDNITYQRLLKSYYQLLVESGDLKMLVHAYESENKELIELNRELQDELDSVREDHDELDSTNLLLKKAIKTFVQELKKLQENEDQPSFFDFTI